MADWVEAVRLVHLVLVALWLGGGLFAILMILPNVRASGAAGKGFMMTVIRRGGFGKFFGPVGGLAILSGLVLFWGRGYHSAPFADVPTSMLTIGALIGLASFIEGLAVNLPTEKKLQALVAQVGPQGPTPEQAKELEALGMKSGKASLRGTAMLVVAFLLMAGRTLAL